MAIMAFPLKMPLFQGLASKSIKKYTLAEYCLNCTFVRFK